eukprot:scaffold990_cov393-Prasinococcus_capsulatus_cf.AAC.51
MSVTLKNVVVKYDSPSVGAVATITCESISTYAVDDAWEKAVSDSEVELLRVVEIANLSVALDKSYRVGRMQAFQQPLLRAQAIRMNLCVPLVVDVSRSPALFPGQRVRTVANPPLGLCWQGFRSEMSTHLEFVVDSIQVSLSDEQCSQIRRLGELFRTYVIKFAKTTGTQALDESALVSQGSSTTQVPGREVPEEASSVETRTAETLAPSTSISGMLGRAWGYIANDDLASRNMEKRTGMPRQGLPNSLNIVASLGHVRVELRNAETSVSTLSAMPRSCFASLDFNRFFLKLVRVKRKTHEFVVGVLDLKLSCNNRHEKNSCPLLKIVPSDSKVDQSKSEGYNSATTDVTKAPVKNCGLQISWHDTMELSPTFGSLRDLSCITGHVQITLQPGFNITSNLKIFAKALREPCEGDEVPSLPSSPSKRVEDDMNNDGMRKLLVFALSLRSLHLQVPKISLRVLSDCWSVQPSAIALECTLSSSFRSGDAWNGARERERWSSQDRRETYGLASATDAKVDSEPGHQDQGAMAQFSLALDHVCMWSERCLEINERNVVGREGKRTSYLLEPTRFWSEIRYSKEGDPMVQFGLDDISTRVMERDHRVIASLLSGFWEYNGQLSNKFEYTEASDGPGGVVALIGLSKLGAEFSALVGRNHWKISLREVNVAVVARGGSLCHDASSDFSGLEDSAPAALQLNLHSISCSGTEDSTGLLLGVKAVQGGVARCRGSAEAVEMAGTSVLLLLNCDLMWRRALETDKAASQAEITINEVSGKLSRAQHRILFEYLHRKRRPWPIQAVNGAPSQPKRSYLRVRIPSAALEVALWTKAVSEESDMLILIARELRMEREVKPSEGVDITNVETSASAMESELRLHVDYLELCENRKGPDESLVPIVQPLRQKRDSKYASRGPHARWILRMTQKNGYSPLSGKVTTKISLEINPIQICADMKLVSQIVDMIVASRIIRQGTARREESTQAMTGKISCGGINLELTDLAGDSNISISWDNFVMIMHDALGDDVRRWVGDSNHESGQGAIVQGIDVTALGLEGSLYCRKGKSTRPSPFLERTDLRLICTLRGHARPMGMLLDFMYPRVRLSRARLLVIVNMCRDLVVVLSRLVAKRDTLVCNPAYVEDLRSGLFRMSQVKQSRPLPLQLSLSDGDQTFRSGSGWISWRYPYARAVQVHVAKGPHPSEKPRNVRYTLRYYDERANRIIGAFDPPVEAAFEDSVVLGSTVYAEEWWLCWCPASVADEDIDISGFGATELLPRVHVNGASAVSYSARGGEDLAKGNCGDSVITPLAPGTAVSVQATCVNLHWLEDGTEEEPQDIACMTAESLDFSLHLWSKAFAVNASAKLKLELADMSTYTYQTVIPAFQVQLRVENRDETSLGPSSFPEFSTRIADVRPPPSAVGMYVTVRTDSAMMLRMSRSAIVGFTAISNSVRSTVRSLHSNASQEATYDPSRGLHTPSTTPLYCPALPPLQDELNYAGFTIENLLPINLWLGQVGTNEARELHAGRRLQYSWRYPTILMDNQEQKLQFCVASERERHWCDPIRPTKSSSHRRVLQITEQTGAAIVAVVGWTGRQWCITLRGGYRLVNRAGVDLAVRCITYSSGVHVSSAREMLFTLSSPVGENSAIAEDASCRDLFFVEERSSDSAACQLSIQLEGLSHSKSGSTKWSQVVPLDAGSGYNATVLLRPVSSEDTKARDLQQYWCAVRQSTEDDPFTSVTFWPLYFLSNNLPVDLWIRVGSTELSLAPGSEVPLNLIDRDPPLALSLAQSLSSTGMEKMEPSQEQTETGLYLTHPRSTMLGTEEAQAGRTSAVKLGAHIGIELARNEALFSLSALLSAEAFSRESPSWRLSISPYAILRNFTPMALALADQSTPGVVNACAEASCTVPFAVEPVEGPAKSRPPRNVRIGVFRGVGKDDEDPIDSMRDWAWSEVFSVEKDTHHRILLDVQGKAEPLAVLVCAEYVESSYNPGAPKCCVLSVHPWAVTSNLTDVDLLLSGTAELENAITLKAGETGKYVPVSLPAFGSLAPSIATETLEAKDNETTGRSHCHVYLARTALEEVKSTEKRPLPCGEWSSPIDVSRSVGKRRLWLKPASLSRSRDDAQMMFTYRILVEKGQVHLIVYRDQQPPDIIHNCTKQALQVQPQLNGQPAGCFECPPMGTLECSLTPHDLGYMLDREDVDVAVHEEDDVDEMFRLLKQNSSSSVWVRLRWHDSEQWSDSVDLIETPQEIHLNTDTGQDATVIVQATQESATRHIVILERSARRNTDQNQTTGVSNTSAYNTMRARTAFSIQIALREVSLHVVDDDHSPNGFSKGNREICCLAVDSLGIGVEKVRRLDGNEVAGMYSIQAEAQAAQLDSYLEDSDFPVVFITEPQYDEAGSRGSIPSLPTDKALAISVKVCRSSEGHITLGNTWIQQLSLRLCPLVVNVDDALLKLVRELQDLKQIRAVSGRYNYS